MYLYGVNIINIVVSLAFLIFATITDTKTGKIPNWLTLTLFGIAVALCVIDGHIKGAIAYARIITMILIFFSGYYHYIGMGDIKLLMGLALINDGVALMGAVIIGLGLMIIHNYYKNPLKTTSGIYRGVLGIVSKNPSNLDTCVPDEITPFTPFLLLGFILLTGGEMAYASIA